MGCGKRALTYRASDDAALSRAKQAAAVAAAQRQSCMRAFTAAAAPFAAYEVEAYFHFGDFYLAHDWGGLWQIGSFVRMVPSLSDVARDGT